MTETQKSSGESAVTSPTPEVTGKSRRMASPLLSDSSVSKPTSPKRSTQKKVPSRALKACASCRKQKTRCFPSANAIACLRCSSVGAVCSFEKEAILKNSPPGGLTVAGGEVAHNFSSGGINNRNLAIDNDQKRGLVDVRLKMLQNDVSEILSLLKKDGDSPLSEDQRLQKEQRFLDNARATEVTPLTDIASIKLFQHSNSVVNLNNLPSFGVPPSSFQVSPFKNLNDICSTLSLNPPIATVVDNSSWNLPQTDLVTLGILTFDECLTLLQNFRDRYGRWVSFPEDLATPTLLVRIREKCSLLLTACCCLSLKYGYASLKERVYKQVLQRLRIELGENLLYPPQTIEFLQSLIVLSFYGITLATDDFAIDSWYISGLALQHFISMNQSGQLLSRKENSIYYDDEFYELTIHRIWNHLSLNHIVYSLFSGRMCVVDELRLNLSRKILELSSATNFDGRIVAEILVHLIVYNCVQFSSGQQSLTLVKEELKNWFDQWSYLFEQPANQFVELGYHYGYLLILHSWNYSKLISQEVNPNEIFLKADSITLRSMIFHCQKIIDTMLDTPNDSYFAFLSDQVHFSAMFATTLLMKMLYVINSQAYNNGADILNKVEMSKNELHKNLTNCSKLSKRYRKICIGDKDVFMKYHLTISDILNALFPDFEKFEK